MIFTCDDFYDLKVDIDPVSNYSKIIAYFRKEGEGGLKGMYDKVPEAFKTQLLVKATVEDPEIQAQRAELIKEKSVNELSQVTSFSEFPVPDTIERLASRQGAVERKKRFREK